MSKVPAALRESIRTRAGNRCEYCKLPAAFAYPRHQPDHIIPIKHAGIGEAANLAFACAHCNRYKGPNLSGRDPVTGEVAALYNPRKDIWSEHFEWVGAVLKGRSVTGKATIHTLQMNHPLRLAFRRRLIEEGVFDTSE